MRPPIIEQIEAILDPIFEGTTACHYHILYDCDDNVSIEFVREGDQLPSVTLPFKNEDNLVAAATKFVALL